MPNKNSTMDKWNIGIFNKNGLWVYYSITNLLGVITCFVLWLSIVLSKKKISGDIFIAGLAFGCVTMSIPCVIQCILNLINNNNKFEYGKIACELEAYLHTSAIIFQFFNVGLISWSYHAMILRNKTEVMSRKEILRNAYKYLCVIMIISYVGTYVIGYFSTIDLVDSGTYCFYNLRSYVMLYWFDPILIITTCLIIYWYKNIYQYTKKSVTTTKSNNKIVIKLGYRITLYILVLIICWLSVLIVSVYVLVKNPNEYAIGDIIIRIFSSLHSLLVGMVYGYNSDKLRSFLKLKCKCQCINTNAINDVVPIKRSTNTIATNGNNNIFEIQYEQINHKCIKINTLNIGSPTNENKLRVNSLPDNISIEHKILRIHGTHDSPLSLHSPNSPDSPDTPDTPDTPNSVGYFIMERKRTMSPKLGGMRVNAWVQHAKDKSIASNYKKSRKSIGWISSSPALSSSPLPNSTLAVSSVSPIDGHMVPMSPLSPLSHV